MASKLSGTLAALLLVFVMCVTAGCMRLNADITINKDGSVAVSKTITTVPQINEMAEDMKNKETAANSSAKVTPVSDGDYSGYKIDTAYNDMEDFAQNGGNYLASYNGINKGIQKKAGWLFDAYSLDLYFQGNKSDNSSEAQMAKSMMQGMRCNLTFNLPYASISNNADRVSNEGKTLSWNLVPALLNGTSKSMQATFRIWNTSHIVITAIIVIIGLGALVVGIIRWTGALPEDRNRWLILFIVGVALTAGAGGYSAGTVLSKDTFTDANIISNQLGGHEAKNEASLDTLESRPAPKAKNPDTKQPTKGQTSGRQAQAPAPAIDLSTPEGVFRNYHKLITDRNFQDAFNCFTPSMQSGMGDYGTWVQGYATTVSSVPEVVDVLSNDGSVATLSFRLKAIDRDGSQNKVQYFKGTCRLVRSGNSWLIDEISTQVA